MRGGSAPSWRQGQGLCPAEKAETAARCGFTVPVLEGAGIVVRSRIARSLVPRRHERPGAAGRKSRDRVAGGDPGAPVDPDGSIHRSWSE